MKNDYKSNFTDLITNNIKNKITVFNVLVAAKTGAPLAYVDFFPALVPDIDNLEEDLNNSYGLKAGFFSAIDSFSEGLFKRVCTGFDIGDDLYTKLHSVNDKYVVAITHDKLLGESDRVDDFVKSLSEKIGNLLLNKYSKEIKDYEEHSSTSQFDNLEKEIAKMAYTGLNNKEIRSKIYNFLYGLEKESVCNTFMGEEAIKKAKNNFKKLENLDKLYPNLEIDVKKYERMLKKVDNSKHKKNQELNSLGSKMVDDSEKRLQELLSNFKSRIEEYTSIWGRNKETNKEDFSTEEKKKSIGLFINELKSNEVYDGIKELRDLYEHDEVRMAEIKEKLVKEASYLEGLLKNFDKNQINIRVRVVDAKDMLYNFYSIT